MNARPCPASIRTALTERTQRPGPIKRPSWLTSLLSLGWALAFAGAWSATAQEDVFVIRADVSFTSSDQYHYERKFSDGFLKETKDAQDSFSYHYVGQQTIRTTRPDWTETFENIYTVSGGGSWKAVVYDRYYPPETDEFQWGYFFDPEQTSESDADMAELGYKFEDCWVVPFPSWPVGMQSSLGPGIGGEANLHAMSVNILMPSTFYIDSIPLPTNTTTYTVTRTYSTNVVTPHNFEGESGQVSTSYRCTITIQRNPAQLEAVILPDPPPLTPLPRYEDWMPTGGSDEDTPGTNLFLRVILRPKGSQDREAVSYGSAKFKFFLNDVSREPGLCMNYPANGKSKSPPDPDLRFFPASHLDVAEDGLSAETLQDDLSETGFVISAFDYGAFGKLKVTAEIAGQGVVTAFVIDRPEQEFLTIPKDENGNRLADAWEMENGTWDEIVDPAWDQADMPDGQDADGDGISLYEKYRGFVFGQAHERLQPRLKHLFVHDADGLVRLNLQSTQSFQAASLLRVRFVKPGTWTGAGTSGGKKRIVNFNTSGFGHATDQHAEHVRMVVTKAPVTPSDYQTVYRAKYGTNTTQRVDNAFGMTWPDYSVEKASWSPEQWLAIECYVWNVDNYARNIVRYHTHGLPQFAGYADATAAAQAAMDEQVKQLAAQHIASNPDAWEELNWKVLMMTTSHEMGHGIAVEDLQPPNTGGPRKCFMRYIGYEYPRNPADRFELVAKWQKSTDYPTIFCEDPATTRRGKGCFEQIHVTDREGGGASPAHDGGSGSRPWLSNMQGEEALPPLQVSAGLEWESPLAGDPLRVMVRLNAPMASALWEFGLLNGDTSQPPPAPNLASNWFSGLRLELARVETDGTRTALIPSGDWAGHMREMVVDPAVFESRLAAWHREFLVSPETSKLQSGNYVLRVSWVGSGLVDPRILQGGDTLNAEEILFNVLEPFTVGQQAEHLRRLAYFAWDKGDNAAAYQFGSEAIRLDPDNHGRDALETYLLVASAQVREGNWYGSAATLESLQRTVPHPVFFEFAEQVGRLRSALVPELRMKEPGSSTGPARMEVIGLAGQRYQLQASTDLVNWEGLQTFDMTSNRYDVLGPTDTRGRNYFRLAWIQP